MLYLKAQELSQIQDVFNANPLQEEAEIDQSEKQLSYIG